MAFLPWIITGLIFIAATAVVLLVLRRSGAGDQQLQTMHEQLAGLRQDMQEQIGTFSNTFNTTVKDHLQDNLKVMQESQQQVGTRMDNAARVISEVQNRLGKLDESSRRIFEVGKDISSLQEILKAPKLRGGLGELFLGDLLSQVMPAEHYGMQHRFKSGETVDAVVRLSDKFVPIDSKFPLENFRKFVTADEEAERKSARKLFITDVKKHIDAIAEKYIRPDEQTFDFALMYIPAENVYYETIIKDDTLGGDKSLSSYAMHKRVIPVSPNNFYVYLNTILLGLRGFKIEKSVNDIIANISRLKGDFDRFNQDFDLLGKHLNNARTTFEKADKRLDRFNEKLTGLEAPSEAERPSLKEVVS